MKQRAVNRIQQPEPYQEETGIRQGLQTGTPVRSLLNSQEMSFKFLDELHEVITSLENRLYHILSPEEATPETDESNAKLRPSSSTGVSMAIQTNDSINRCIYRLRNIHDRIEL